MPQSDLRAGSGFQHLSSIVQILTFVCALLCAVTTSLCDPKWDRDKVTMKLATCLLNISEARNMEVVRAVIKAAVDTITRTSPIGATVLNAFVDQEYNRSVITISGRLHSLELAVVSACEAATRLIDMRAHIGGHPRLGSVDLIPLHPITEDTSIKDCDILANQIVSRLTKSVPESSFFIYGSQPGQRGLIERRKEFGWFQSKVKPDAAPDIGTINSRCGLTGVGAAPYMSNFNISLETSDLRLAERVLRAIRSSTGGFPGVSAMAFPHHNNVEIACNVDMVTRKERGDMEEIFPGFWRTRFSAIEARVSQVASEAGVSVLGNSVIIGFTPDTARQLTLEALSRGQPSLVTSLASDHM